MTYRPRRADSRARGKPRRLLSAPAGANSVHIQPENVQYAGLKREAPLDAGRRVRTKDHMTSDNYISHVTQNAPPPVPDFAAQHGIRNRVAKRKGGLDVGGGGKRSDYEHMVLEGMLGPRAESHPVPMQVSRPGMPAAPTPPPTNAVSGPPTAHARGVGAAWTPPPAPAATAAPEAAAMPGVPAAGARPNLSTTDAILSKLLDHVSNLKPKLHYEGAPTRSLMPLSRPPGPVTSYEHRVAKPEGLVAQGVPGDMPQPTIRESFRRTTVHGNLYVDRTPPGDLLLT